MIPSITVWVSEGDLLFSLSPFLYHLVGFGSYSRVAFQFRNKEIKRMSSALSNSIFIVATLLNFSAWPFRLCLIVIATSFKTRIYFLKNLPCPVMSSHQSGKGGESDCGLN